MSFSEWQKYKLGDLVTFQRGHDLAKTEFIEGEFPIAGSNGIIGYHNKFTTKAPSLTVGRSGNLGTPHFYNKNFWAHNTTLYVKEFHNSDPKFIYYLLQTLDLKQFNSGSAVPSLNRNYIHPIVVAAPDLKIQERIASILSSLDDAIELNQQINKTLEEMAKAIFKEWFVDFNFPNATGNFQETEIGKIPVGWKVGKLNEALEIKYGKDHKHLQDGNIPVYGSGGIMRYAEKPLYESESILIPRKGTLSNLFYINKPFWTVDTMFYSKIKIKNSGKYLFHLLQSLNLASMNVGSAVPSLTTEVLNNILIAIPKEDVLLKFEVVVSSLFVQIEQNIEENQSLINLRDTLLPKLMKGEINLEPNLAKV